MALRGAVVASLLLMASADLASLLVGLKGQTDVDCEEVCKAEGKDNGGMSMSSLGEVRTTTCSCGENEVKVACVGRPFIQCCKDKCEGTDCPKEAAGWKCPANNGCDGGNCDNDKAGLWKDWVAAHNIYRCMHNVPPVSWNHAVYQDAATTFENKGEMEHSACYDVKPPAGPAGENLFMGTGEYSPLDPVKAWYSEVKDCGPFPGCSEGKKGVVGHFTALIWNGVQTIGCFNNKHKIWVCRYKAADYKNCNTPNFGGDESYTTNVFPKVKTFQECLAEVNKCGFSEPKGASEVGAIGYNELSEASLDLPSVMPSLTGVFAVFAVGLAVGFAFLGVRRMQTRGQKLSEALVDEAEVEMTIPE